MTRAVADSRRSRGYSLYVLGLFMVIYAVNFIDRQIVSILAPDLKADLGLTDAQIGLLFGTAFALFYALFGLPMARLADSWHRVRTMALGLTLWSGMTALSGLSGNFAHLGLARMGVGIGEAAASPAAFSILQDYFPRRQRATVLSVYSSGIYFGSGLSLVLGGWIIATWQGLYPLSPPFGFKGWQIAFLAVGIPGLLLAAVTLLTVREPVRGAIDGQPQPREPRPFRTAFMEMAALFPPFSLVVLHALGGDGRAVRRNMIALAACILLALAATIATNALLDPARLAVVGHFAGMAITTNFVQWAGFFAASYAVFCWVQATRLRDPAAFALMIATPAFALLPVVSGLISFIGYSLNGFLFVYARRYLDLGPQAGLTIGIITAITGTLGTIGGGFVADWAKRRHGNGRLWVAAASSSAVAIATAVQYSTTSTTIFYIAYGCASTFATIWIGPIAATCQDLVLPRMRGAATAVMFLGANLIGMGLGPYCVGLVSDITGNLRFAILSVFVMLPVILLCLWLAGTRLAAAEESVTARALTAGEPI